MDSNNYQHGGRMGLKCIPSHFSPWTESAAFLLSLTEWLGGLAIFASACSPSPLPPLGGGP